MGTFTININERPVVYYAPVVQNIVESVNTCGGPRKDFEILLNGSTSIIFDIKTLTSGSWFSGGLYRVDKSGVTDSISLVTPFNVASGSVWTFYETYPENTDKAYYYFKICASGKDLGNSAGVEISIKETKNNTEIGFFEMFDPTIDPEIEDDNPVFNT